MCQTKHDFFQSRINDILMFDAKFKRFWVVEKLNVIGKSVSLCPLLRWLGWARLGQASAGYIKGRQEGACHCIRYIQHFNMNKFAVVVRASVTS